jgi:hypothetical protein
LFAFFFCLGADGEDDEADADEDEVKTDELFLFTFEKHFELFNCFFFN